MDFANIRDDVINLVTENPEYNQKWDDFLSSDAGRMMIELFAYITENLSTRVDWVANENWLSTATQKSSVMRILKILGYNFTLPIASGVDVTMTIPSIGYGDSWPGSFYLTPAYKQPLTLTPFSLSAKDRKGVTRSYEALPYDSYNSRYDYKVGILIGDTFAVASQKIKFFEGKTYVETFTATTNNAFSFTLNKFPVIENSLRVYFADDVGLTENEYARVVSFLDAEAQQTINPLTGLDRPIPYILTVGENDTVTVSFGPTSLLPISSRRPSIGDKIRVFYRSGGGLDGNLVRDAINTVQLLTVIPNLNPADPRNIHIGFENLTEGQGGQDSETSEHAIVYAPLSIRTVEKAVTAEDYNIILNGNTNIITAKSFGAGNAPLNVFSRYGVNIQPTEVWNYVVPKQTGWEGIATSKYNDFYWMSLYLDNRFNEQYSFRPGAFNYPNTFYSTQLLGTTKGDTIYWKHDRVGDSFFNYTYLETPIDFKTSFIGDTKFRAKVTTALDTTQQLNNLTNLVVGDTIFIAGDSRLRITKNIQAYYVSNVNLSEGVDLTNNKFIKLNIDKKGDTVVDLTRSVLSTLKNNIHAFEIAAAINSKLRGLVGMYGDSYGDSLGVNGGATVYQTGTYDYVRIKGALTGGVNSKLLIQKPNTNLTDATTKVLGLPILTLGDTYVNYGYKRLTVVRNNALSSFGKIVYENGSVSLSPDPSTYYVHYVKADTLAVRLGTYFNYNFIQGTDVQYRSVANRVYNTVKVTGDSTLPDMNLSDFQLHFTKTATASPSLYAINNDWNLYYATPAYLTGPTIGDSVTLGKGHYRMRISIDGKGDTIVRIAGDSGGDSHYYLSRIGDTINTQLRVAYSADSYISFTYAYFDPVYKRLSIKSPFANNSSQVHISPIDTNRFTVVNELFGLEENLSYTFKVNGDYYLKYNRPADLMEMIKTNTGFSQMPDATFFTHFLWDRRNVNSTDEFTHQTFLQNKKIIGIDNVFKKTFFGVFDVQGTIYYNKNYSLSEVKNNVEAAVRNEYNFVLNQVVNRDFGQVISRSKILNLIHSITGVEYVVINYFGKDMTDTSTNQENTIFSEFDEIIVLSENLFFNGAQIHGMLFNYLIYEG
jgi:hypothetical protein